MEVNRNKSGIKIFNSLKEEKRMALVRVTLFTGGTGDEENASTATMIVGPSSINAARITRLPLGEILPAICCKNQNNIKKIDTGVILVVGPGPELSVAKARDSVFLECYLEGRYVPWIHPANIPLDGQPRSLQAGAILLKIKGEKVS